MFSMFPLECVCAAVHFGRSSVSCLRLVTGCGSFSSGWWWNLTSRMLGQLCGLVLGQLCGFCDLIVYGGVKQLKLV